MNPLPSCAIAALILLLMLPNLIWLWFGHGIDVWMDALVVPSILLLVLFALLGNRLWLACLVLAPFAMIANYHHPTFPEIIATIVATNPRMAGVNFPGHDSSWSSFSSRWRYRPRIVNDQWQEDIDHAAFGNDCKIVLPP